MRLKGKRKEGSPVSEFRSRAILGGRPRVNTSPPESGAARLEGLRVPGLGGVRHPGANRAAFLFLISASLKVTLKEKRRGVVPRLSFEITF